MPKRRQFKVGSVDATVAHRLSICVRADNAETLDSIPVHSALVTLAREKYGFRAAAIEPQFGGSFRIVPAGEGEDKTTPRQFERTIVITDMP